MEAQKVKAEARQKLGTKYTRRLREKGGMPAIVYGHGEDPLAVALPAHEIKVHLHHGEHLLDLDLNGKSATCLIRDVQYDHLGTTPIHLDLVRVNLTETVTVNVGIELRGTPKGVGEGGVLDQNLTEVEVECRVTDIPDTLRPRVTHLEIGDALLVKDLDFPPEVKCLADPEERVASVTIITPEVEEEEEVTAEEEAQPEVITRGKREEEEGESSSESKE